MALNNGWTIIRINLLENYTGSFEQLWSVYKPTLNNLGIRIMDEEAKECYIKSQTGIFKLIVEITKNNPELSQQGITNKLKEKYGYQLTRTSICNYLKKSNELSLTNYKDKDTKRAVICITTGEILGSTMEAERQTGVNHSSISACCRGKYKSAGLINGKPAIWMYLEDYEKLSKEEVNKIKNQETPNEGRTKAVICLNTRKIYESTMEAERQTGVNQSSISACCRGVRKSAGKDENGNKLVWMYLEDYEDLK